MHVCVVHCTMVCVGYMYLYICENVCACGVCVMHVYVWYVSLSLCMHVCVCLC